MRIQRRSVRSTIHNDPVHPPPVNFRTQQPSLYDRCVSGLLASNSVLRHITRRLLKVGKVNVFPVRSITHKKRRSGSSRIYALIQLHNQIKTMLRSDLSEIISFHFIPSFMPLLEEILVRFANLKPSMSFLHGHIN